MTTEIIGCGTGIWNTVVAGGKKVMSARREGDWTYFKCVHASTSTGYEQKLADLLTSERGPHHWIQVLRSKTFPEYTNLERKQQYQEKKKKK